MNRKAKKQSDMKWKRGKGLRLGKGKVKGFNRPIWVRRRCDKCVSGYHLAPKRP